MSRRYGITNQFTRGSLALLATVLVAGCASAPSSGPRPGAGDEGVRGRGGGGGIGRAVGVANADAAALYVRNGLMAATAPVPFVGRLAFFASPSPDSVLALLTLSLPTRGLTFVREGERYRAGYSVVADIRALSGGVSQRVVEANEAVRVLSVQETQRNEESVIFQKFFTAPIGNFRVSMVLRDQSSGRASSYEGDVEIPNVRERTVSTALSVHEADRRTSLTALPKLVASPRATGIFGRDSVIYTYVEAYGGNRGPVLRYDVVNELGTTLAIDSVRMNGSGDVSAALIRIPVTTVGLGVGHIRLWFPGQSDTVRAPLFVGFGEDLPVASFNDMLNYLQFYISPGRLTAMRQAAEDQRAELWAAFLKETDPVASTPQHEGLLAYFDRVRRANERFRGENVDGWLTDRGKVYVTLGEPDQLTASNSGEFATRSRTFVWEYQRYNLRLVFVDRNGLGRWTLDPISESEFNGVAQRERAG